MTDNLEVRVKGMRKWLDSYRTELETEYNKAIEEDEDTVASDMIWNKLAGVEDCVQIVRACLESELWLLEQMGKVER